MSLAFEYVAGSTNSEVRDVTEPPVVLVAGRTLPVTAEPVGRATSVLPEPTGRASALSLPHAARAKGTMTSAVHEKPRMRVLRVMVYMGSSSLGAPERLGGGETPIEKARRRPRIRVFGQ